LPAPALAHAHRELGDFKTGAVQQQNGLRLGIIFGVPMRESVDDFFVGGAEAGGTVGDEQAAEHVEDGFEQPRAEAAHDRLVIMPGLEKARADDEVAIAAGEVIDEFDDFGRAVLSVAVDLDGDVVAVQCGVAVAGLHRAANAEVEGQRDDDGGRGDAFGGVVGRAIIDDEDVVAGQSAGEAVDESVDRSALIERGNDREAAKFGGGCGHGTAGVNAMAGAERTQPAMDCARAFQFPAKIDHEGHEGTKVTKENNSSCIFFVSFAPS
jgi:hypothetical protein